ncbi:MAG: hypothetical protein PHF14_01685, partial [Verrucomicrobiota bacterium]|nr:hypothetical protein [Verrucomicrobiota bacterium]
RPFDTETDSDPDPDLASPLTFSDSDGEVSRRDRRGRRGVLGGRKRDLHRSRFQQLLWSTESV